VECQINAISKPKTKKIKAKLKKKNSKKRKSQISSKAKG